jgi:hypothetical protein
MEKRSRFKKRSMGTRNISLNWFLPRALDILSFVKDCVFCEFCNFGLNCVHFCKLSCTHFNCTTICKKLHCYPRTGHDMMMMMMEKP